MTTLILRSNENFATCHNDGSIITWSNGKKIKKSRVHKDEIHRICSLPGDCVFTTSADGRVKVLEKKLRLKHEMTGTTQLTECIANHDHIVAVGDRGGFVYYYDTASSNESKVIE